MAGLDPAISLREGVVNENLAVLLEMAGLCSAILSVESEGAAV